MRDFKARKPRRFKVRCLGPGREHTFMSTDPVRNRVCERCQEKIRQVRDPTPVVVSLPQKFKHQGE